MPSVGADLSAAIEEYAIALLATKGCLKNRLFVIDATLPVYYALCQMGIMHFITKWCMEVGEKLMVKTFEEARLLIRELQICTIFESSKSGLPSLWEYVDLPEKQPGEEGWGEKVTAVWDWKNRLPATYPDEIFYGKIKGGFAVLMTMGYLRDFHFASCHRSIAQLNPLAATIFEKIRNEPWETTELRYEVMEAYGCSILKKVIN